MRHAELVEAADTVEFMVSGAKTEVDGAAAKISVYGVSALANVGLMRKIAHSYGMRVDRSSDNIDVFVMEAK
jgi:hypothetical protein